VAKPAQTLDPGPVAEPLLTPANEPAAKHAPRSKAPVTRCVGTYEREARQRGFKFVAGVDEVGRGSLFGPVFAAAVILHPEKPIRGLHDSKILEADDRNRLAAEIKRKCVGWAVGAADAYEIDQINILQASRLAMRRAVERLQPKADFLLIDAITVDLAVEQLPLIDGDARCRAIAAASILAKVQRDACLDQWHEAFPQYNLKSNKGYSTPDHRRALSQFGPTSLHRFSFEPVRLASPVVLWTGYVNSPTQLDLFAGAQAASDEMPALAAAGGEA
jgi:ribonuclease HII